MSSKTVTKITVEQTGSAIGRPAEQRATLIGLGLNKIGRRKALTNVTFICDAGEIVGLLGPNGAGKSTLLNILATLLSPSKGTITYGDRTAADGVDSRQKFR